MERPKLIDAPWGADEFLNNSAAQAGCLSRYVNEICAYALSLERRIRELEAHLDAAKWKERFMREHEKPDGVLEHLLSRVSALERKGGA